MAKLNPRRRAAKRARLESQALAASVRASLVPEVAGYKSASVIARDSLLGASHTPGFTGAGRSAGRTTVELSAKGSMAASVVDMNATVRFGKAMPPKGYRTTAPKSKPFNKDGYDDGCRHPKEPRASVAPWSAKKLHERG